MKKEGIALPGAEGRSGKYPLGRNIRERSLRMFFPVFLMLFFLTAGLLPARAAAENSLTLMVYMCGSDLESGSGAATADLREITAACAGKKGISVLVLLGGTRSWREGFDPEELHLVEIGARGRRELQRYPGMSMGSAEALSLLLTEGPAIRPAAEYALILWDHGGGPMEGLCFDELYRADGKKAEQGGRLGGGSAGHDSLSLTELGQALEEAHFTGEDRLAWIGFDACLMSSVETAKACAPYADYMIASQETEPGSGWNYAFITEMEAGEPAETTGRRIVAHYTEDKAETDMLTLALIRLDRIAEVTKATDAFFQAAGQKLTKETFSSLSRSRLRTKGFGRASTGSDYDLADLRHLTEQLAGTVPVEAAALQSALDEAVIETAGNQPHAGGLSLYSPYYNQERYADRWLETYTQWGILPGYRQFLRRYDTLWTGESMADWSHLIGKSQPRSEADRQTVEITLTEEQLIHFADASCLILEDHGSESVFNQIYLMEDLTLEGDTLRAEYGFDALYAVDENGTAQTDPIPFIVREGYYLLYATLEKSSLLVSTGESADGEEWMSIALQCRRNGQELEIVNIIPCVSGEGALNLGRETIQLDGNEWPYLRFSGIPREETRDGEGNLLPFLKWTTDRGIMATLDALDRKGNRISYWDWNAEFGKSGALPEGVHHVTEVENGRPWALRFMPCDANGKDLKAQFILRDTQGHEWGSELIHLERPGELTRAPVSCRETVSDGCILRPLEIKAIRNAGFQGLCLRTEVENDGDSNVYLYGYGFILNGKTTLPEKAITPTYRIISPGDKAVSDLMIPLSALPEEEPFLLRKVSFMPILSFEKTDGMSSAYLPRLDVATELDLAPLELKAPETAVPIAETQWWMGLSMDLVSLRETEPGVFSGRAVLRNGGSTDKRIDFRSYGYDDAFAFEAENLLLRNCLEVPPILDLFSGGSCEFDFKLRTEEDGSLRVINLMEGETASIPERLERIESCGFLFGLTGNVEAPLNADADPEIKWFHFSMTEAVTPETPIPLIYDPEVGATDEGPGGNTALSAASDGDGESAPEDAADGHAASETGIESDSPSDPYPFFRETVELPVSPEQYALAFRCPIPVDEQDKVDYVTVLLTQPRPLSEDVSDLLAVVHGDQRMENGGISIRFCGLLPSLMYAKQSFPCTVTEDSETGEIRYTFNCSIYLSGIHGLPKTERNFSIDNARLVLRLNDHSARFTEYQVNSFRPGAELDSAVVFYHLPIQIIRTEDGSETVDFLEGEEAISGSEGHLFVDAPDILMRPAEDLRPEVVFYIWRKDDSVFMIQRTWEEATAPVKNDGNS